MSIISNVHKFLALTKDSKAFQGQRLVRLIAKGANKHANLSESLCVSVPVVTTEEVVESIDRLIPHVVALVKDAQDKIIREWRIEHGREAIPSEEFGIEQVIGWLDAEAAGDRVSSEYLQEWFMDEYGSVAREYIASAMGLQLAEGEVTEVVEQKVNILRDMFAGYSSGKYSPNIPKLRAMIKFGEVCSDVDGRMSSYLTRAAKMLATKEAELSENALGF